MTELLGNVLPGVRSLRAPFSAGALTLLAAWIYYRHDVGHSARFKSISADIDALRGLTNGVGAATILGFVTYIVGAAITTFSDLVLRVLRAAGWFRPLRPWFTAEVTSRFSDLVEVDKRPADLKAEAPHVGDYWRLLEAGGDHGFWEFLRPSRWCHPWQNGSAEMDKLRRARREWRQLHFRLLQDAPSYHTEIDRLEAEGEFRFAIALPLMLLGLAIAARANSSWPALAAAAATVLLLIGGTAAQRESETTLTDLVLDGRVTLPYFDQLEAARPLAPARQTTHRLLHQLLRLLRNGE